MVVAAVGSDDVGRADTSEAFERGEETLQVGVVGGEAQGDLPAAADEDRRDDEVAVAKALRAQLAGITTATETAEVPRPAADDAEQKSTVDAFMASKAAAPASNFAG